SSAVLPALDIVRYLSLLTRAAFPDDVRSLSLAKRSEEDTGIDLRTASSHLSAVTERTEPSHYHQNLRCNLQIQLELLEKCAQVSSDVSSHLKHFTKVVQECDLMRTASASGVDVAVTVTTFVSVVSLNIEADALEAL
ncbi:uncharacterized protein V6R79_018579, partial [Siganus canaliculatus]